MRLSERIERIEGIAAILGSGIASHTWDITEPNITLRVKAGKKSWGIAAKSEPVGAGEDMCTSYLLRKLAYAANVCPKCLVTVTRAALDTKTNKTPRKRYRCSKCLYSWNDS